MKIKWLVPVGLFILFGGCEAADVGDINPDDDMLPGNGDSDVDTDADADSDSDTDSDADSDTDASDAADSDSGTESPTDTAPMDTDTIDTQIPNDTEIPVDTEVPVDTEIPVDTGPPVNADECNTTGECQAIYGPGANDCVDSWSDTSYCQCGAVRCSEMDTDPVDTDTGIDTGIDTGVDTGIDTGVDTGNGDTDGDATLCANAHCIHVAKWGNDNNAGTAAAPYLTIGKGAEVAQGGNYVIIHEGTYEESVTPARSGWAGSPIVFKGAKGEKVVVSAMQALSGWTHDSGSVYRTQVGWSLGQNNFVMHNQTALDLARWPNNTDGDVYTQDTLRNTGGTGSDVEWNARLDYAPGIPNVDWSNGGSVHFYGDKPGSGWTTWRAFIKSSTGSSVTFDLNKNPTWIRTFHAPMDGGDFFLQGARGVLDYQNEWWFDENSNTLYVQIPGGGAPAEGSIKMRRRTQAFNLISRSYIEIQNLAVLGGSIDINGNNNRLYMVSSFYGNQTLGVVTGFASGAQSVKINGSNNTIEKCEIAYGAGTGVYDSGNGTDILNSWIHHFNSIGNYDAVLNARGGSNSLYSGNILSHSGRDVIQAFNDYSEYSWNDVSYSNLIADDCALIYTVGGPSYSVIHHNWFHDAYSSGTKYKAAGIYLDNDAEEWDVHHNVVWNTEWTNVQINWNGTNLDIFNNTLVKGKATMGAWHKDGTWFTNVRVWNNITDEEGEGAGGQEQEATWEPQADLQNNLVDPNSFMDLAGNDYRLQSNAQAIDYGRQIAGITDGFSGSAPDVGAYEYGENWVPGVDWDITRGPSGDGCYHIPGEDCTD